MKEHEFMRKLKRGKLEKNTNYFRCLNMSKCGEIIIRHKAIRINNPKWKDNQLLTQADSFGNLEMKETHVKHSQVCSRKCGYYMSEDEEQDDLNTCDNPPCNNTLRMNEIQHDTTPEEAKKIHEEMGHVVEDKNTYYCSQKCAVAHKL